MVAYGTMKKSAAWKLYAKSQGIPFEIANDVSDRLRKYEVAVKHADEDEKDNIEVEDYIGKQYIDIYNKSKDYQGVITSWSIAPCSYLLYQGSIRKEIGLVKVKDHLCCLMDGHWAESGHFLKNDLLKVSVVELIYKTFQRIGMKPFSVNELLQKCPPSDKSWLIYKKGCTLGINQVEKAGTSSRAGVYAPKNISELCAFIAAIRPGFKSMYKTFESRKPFSYGIKAFDKLLQTEEMPYSFCLYQEQEMAALNYAGIEMSDCYTAIKNIAKKRVEKVLAYKDKFIDGFKGTIVRDEHKPKEEAEKLADKLWQIIEDSSSYSFNCSHSYCVSVDSLYGAWLKSHHPIEFYENYLRIQEAKGDKDKMNAAKEEAENYFGIKFPPFRFGQDNRSINANIEEKSITNSISSIKGFGSSVGNILYECGTHNFNSFFDLLKWLDEHSMKSSKVIPLIKIDYFQKFGNNRELLRLVDIWNWLKQGTAKSIKKNKLNEEMTKIIKPFANDKGVNGKELKSFNIVDMSGLLNSIEKTIFSLGMEDLDYKVKAANQQECLGYVDLTTGKEEDRKKLYILDIYTLPDKFRGGIWKYKIKTKSIGSGKVSSLSILPAIIQKHPLHKGDIIQVKFSDLVKEKKKGKVYWNLINYQTVI